MRGIKLAVHAGVMMIATTLSSCAQTALQWSCTGKPDLPWEEQIEGCTHAIESGKYIGKDIAWAYYNRGVAYHAKGYYERGMEDYGQAILLDPTNKKYLLERGSAYKKVSDFDRAIADYTETIRLDPNDGMHIAVRGHTYKLKGDNDKAIADLTEAIRLKPHSIFPVYASRGEAYSNNKDYECAISDYNEAIKVLPATKLSPPAANLALVQVLEGRAFAYVKLGQFEKAIADYNAAAKVYPNRAKSLYGRGIAKLYMGDEGGNVDIAYAKVIQRDIATEVGLTPPAAK